MNIIDLLIVIFLSLFLLVPIIGSVIIFTCSIMGLILVVWKGKWLFKQIHINLKLFLICLLLAVTLVYCVGLCGGYFCGVHEAQYDSNRGYYLHRYSLLQPQCGNLGVLTYGSPPPGYLRNPLSLFTEVNLISVPLIFISFILIILSSFAYFALYLKLKNRIVDKK